MKIEVRRDHIRLTLETNDASSHATVTDHQEAVRATIEQAATWFDAEVARLLQGDTSDPLAAFAPGVKVHRGSRAPVGPEPVVVIVNGKAIEVDKVGRYLSFREVVALGRPVGGAERGIRVSGRAQGDAPAGALRDAGAGRVVLGHPDGCRVSVSTTCRRYVVVDSRNKHVCGKPASVIPAIDLYADRSLYPDAPPATMLLGLSHCAECAAMTTIEDLLDDAGWANVSATFMGLRRATPKLSDAVLHWHPVDGEVVKAWQASVDATTARIEREQRHRDN